MQRDKNSLKILQKLNRKRISNIHRAEILGEENQRKVVEKLKFHNSRKFPEIKDYLK